jgi:hypothetical protein
MASIKWLTRIVVTDAPFCGFFQTVDYAYWEERHGLPTRVPITEMQVKSQIARPAMNEVVTKGSAYRVHGAAWTSNSDVTKVELSTDGGKTYAPAKLLGEPMKHVWRLWEYEWRVPHKPGQVTLMARATDAAGRKQPLERDKNRENYMINHVLPINVEIR